MGVAYKPTLYPLPELYEIITAENAYKMQPLVRYQKYCLLYYSQIFLNWHLGAGRSLNVAKSI